MNKEKKAFSMEECYNKLDNEFKILLESDIMYCRFCGTTYAVNPLNALRPPFIDPECCHETEITWFYNFEDLMELVQIYAKK